MNDCISEIILKDGTSIRVIESVHDLYLRISHDVGKYIYIGSDFVCIKRKEIKYIRTIKLQ